MSHVTKQIAKNSTSNIIEVLIHDVSGFGRTGILNTAVSVRTWARGEAGAGVTSTPVVGTIDTFVSGGWIEVDATNLRGVYQYSIPDAYLSVSADEVLSWFEFTDPNIESKEISLQLTAVKNNSGVSISPDGLDQIPIEAYTLLEALKLMASVLCGETSGVETNKTLFKALGNNSIDRLGSTTDETKNRILIETNV